MLEGGLQGEAEGDTSPPARSERFSQTLPVLLMRAREVVVDRFRPILNAHGVTEQQWRVLRALSETPESEVTPLARAVFLRGPSLSRILRDLMARGLVIRRAGDKDLRRGVISIAPAGLALIAATAPEARRAASEINRLYGPERMARLNALLLELEAALDTDDKTENDKTKNDKTKGDDQWPA
jgi:homoprotocatechuate degradation regulator HpaR